MYLKIWNSDADSWVFYHNLNIIERFNDTDIEPDEFFDIKVHDYRDPDVTEWCTVKIKVNEFNGTMDYVVFFDSEAYYCSDEGKTIECFSCKRKAK